MKISGFTMVKNAGKLYYPIKEVILSVLPIVNEFYVALGDCDKDDNTRELIASINSDKIKIVDTVWDIKKYPNGMENAHQTDIAKSYCTGDWLIHLQADEIIHEKYLQMIFDDCQKYLDDNRVEGFLLHYRHFFGDYNHYIDYHGWYPYEIRIIRNRPDIHSFQSAQTFRRIPDFDGINYRNKEGTFKLNVIKSDAYIYHYGWVRPPELMQKKSKALETIHKGSDIVNAMYFNRTENFDWGCMYNMPVFRETHPKVMDDMIDKFYWGDCLHFEKGYKPNNRPLMKHEKTKYRMLTFIEKHLFGGHQIFAYSNWNIIK